MPLHYSYILFRRDVKKEAYSRGADLCSCLLKPEHKNQLTKSKSTVYCSDIKYVDL
jgi:hypothetical protein